MDKMEIVRNSFNNDGDFIQHLIELLTKRYPQKCLEDLTDIKIGPISKELHQLASGDKSPREVMHLMWCRHKDLFFLGMWWKFGKARGTWYRDDCVPLSPGSHGKIPVVVTYDIKRKKLVEVRHTTWCAPSLRTASWEGEDYLVLYESDYASAFVFKTNGKYVGEVSNETKDLEPPLYTNRYDGDFDLDRSLHVTLGKEPSIVVEGGCYRMHKTPAFWPEFQPPTQAE